MDLSSIFQIVILWAHALAAAAWVGGSLFYVFAINPAVTQVGRAAVPGALLGAIGREFREIVRLAILVFAVTGFILAFTRLSDPKIGFGYVAALGLKVVLSLWMFWLAGRIGARVASPPGPLPSGATEGEANSPSPAPLERGPGGEARPWWRRPQYLILVLGVVVYALSYVLRVLYEQALAP